VAEWRSAKQRRIYQSSWITWPLRLWLLWGIVLWKEILCKTWIGFILIKCICFIIKINHVWSRVKNIALKTHCFPKNALFSNMCTFLSHCFETKNYHWVQSILTHKRLWIKFGRGPISDVINPNSVYLFYSITYLISNHLSNIKFLVLVVSGQVFENWTFETCYFTLVCNRT